MGESINTQKICPACGQANKVENAYCRNCGASLDGVESVNVEPEQTTGASETNKVEITETLKGYKYSYLCCMLIMLGIVLGIILLLASMEDVGAQVGAALLSIFLLPVVFCGIIYVLWYTARMSKPRTFIISDQEIKIRLPKKPIFQINWSDFNTIQIFKSNLSIETNRVGYSLNFFSNDGSKREITIELGRDFKRGTAKNIKSLLEQYANRLNKEYIWGRKRKKKI